MLGNETAVTAFAELSLGASTRGTKVSAAAGARFGGNVRKSRALSPTWLCSFQTATHDACASPGQAQAGGALAAGLPIS